MIYANLDLHKYQCNNIVFNQASENQQRTRRRSRKETIGGRAGPGKNNTDKWDRMEPL
ncbi:hypothetical protein [Clostridium sp. chh4-2]|uniref:hypothetical protein n=1 Tax=Clostridium sp. chh4-2 TaxID=2067550 RepID=UPI0015E1AF69|nr:hypothetical protein [Clostridium sp. chh4-2]